MRGKYNSGTSRRGAAYDERTHRLCQVGGTFEKYFGQRTLEEVTQLCEYFSRRFMSEVPGRHEVHTREG